MPGGEHHIDISLLGIADLIDEVEREVANVQQVEDEALEEAAVPVLEEAKRTTAFIDRTGKLRSSLTAGKVGFDIGRGGIKRRRRILIGTFKDKEVRYAKSVELGHGGPTFARAHPFLEPALIHNTSRVESIIAAKLREALKNG